MKDTVPPAKNLDQELEEKKTREFEKELVDLQAKHGRIIVPIIHHTMFGDMLDIAYMTKETYEERLKTGMLASGAKMKGDQ